MSSARLKSRAALRFLAASLGVLLFAYLVHRAGPHKLLECMVAIGWGLLLVLAWGGVPHMVKTWAWRITLRDEKHRVSFSRMLGLRLASEALGQLGGVAQVFGEGLRVSLLGEAMPRVSGIVSVALDRAFFILSGAVVSIFGLLAVLILLPLPHKLTLFARLFVFALLGIILLSAVAVKRRWRIFSRPAQILGRFRYFRAWIERECALIHSVENNLFDFYHDAPGPFWASFALNLACHAAAVLEVCLILWLMGAKVSLFGGLAIESLTKLVNAAGALNPGNLGLYEAGNMLIVKLIGLAGAAGLTLAFTRRLRALFWAAVGGLCLLVLNKASRQRNSIVNDKDGMQIKAEPMSSKQLPTASEPSQNSHTAVILANHL